jgi:hypothetical protein
VALQVREETETNVQRRERLDSELRGKERSKNEVFMGELRTIALEAQVTVGRR